MMQKRFLTLILSVLLLVALVLPAFAAEEEPAPKDYGHPYFITINRLMDVVTVYALDENGYYTVPVRSMICSTGKPGGYETPLGTHTITTFRVPWCRMIDNSCGQFSVQFLGNRLLHAVCCYSMDPSDLITKEYNDLGTNVSQGCCRLQCIDAKWVYENIEPGTRVKVFESEDYGPLGQPLPYIGYISPEADNGWDPTDPREENPWHALKADGLVLEEKTLTLETGLTAALHAYVTPEEASALTPAWKSSDPKVVRVDRRGNLTALKPGKAVVTAVFEDFEEECTVTVKGEPLPFTDVAPGAWYYGQVRHVYEKGMMLGVGEDRFDPDGTLTMAQAVQFLYQLAGKPYVAGISDAEGTPWYAAAVKWAETRDLLSADDFNPDADAPREAFVRLLYLWQQRTQGFAPEGAYASLNTFPDAASVSDDALAAMRWAVGADIIHGADGLLLPQSTLTRAQAATIAQNYSTYRK